MSWRSLASGDRAQSKRLERGTSRRLVKQPKKKPRNEELTDTEKEQNRGISKVRVEVEHQIGGVKRCQIVMQKFRNRIDHYVDDFMETACRLHNFRLTHRQKTADVQLAAA